MRAFQTNKLRYAVLPHERADDREPQDAKYIRERLDDPSITSRLVERWQPEIHGLVKISPGTNALQRSTCAAQELKARLCQTIRDIPQGQSATNPEDSGEGTFQKENFHLRDRRRKKEHCSLSQCFLTSGYVGIELC